MWYVFGVAFTYVSGVLPLTEGVTLGLLLSVPLSIVFVGGVLVQLVTAHMLGQYARIVFTEQHSAAATVGPTSASSGQREVD